MKKKITGGSFYSWLEHRLSTNWREPLRAAGTNRNVSLRTTILKKQWSGGSKVILSFSYVSEAAQQIRDYGIWWHRGVAVSFRCGLPT